ncbi:MAG: hypothetical protein ACRDZ9_05540 [Acidimicrobiales bacterium]
MPTQRCAATTETATRCPGIFAYDLGGRGDGLVVACPLCGVGNRWDVRREEWSVDVEPVGEEWGEWGA